jgi:hypothetical protein
MAKRPADHEERLLHADNRFDAIKAFQKFNFGVRHLN